MFYGRMTAPKANHSNARFSASFASKRFSLALLFPIVIVYLSLDILMLNMLREGLPKNPFHPQDDQNSVKFLHRFQYIFYALSPEHHDCHQPSFPNK
jgi:hypothetical protein